jgi:hypothetical protein
MMHLTGFLYLDNKTTSKIVYNLLYLAEQWFSYLTVYDGINAQNKAANGITTLSTTLGFYK